MSDEYHIGRHVANLFVTQTYGNFLASFVVNDFANHLQRGSLISIR